MVDKTLRFGLGFYLPVFLEVRRFVFKDYCKFLKNYKKRNFNFLKKCLYLLLFCFVGWPGSAALPGRTGSTQGQCSGRTPSAV